METESTLGLKKPRVLIVEHDEEIADLICHLLKQSDLECTSVGNGRDCLKLLDGTVYDLLLIDYSLPELSGIDLIKKLRLIHSSVTLPILLITSRIEPEDVIFGIEAGANDFLPKPFDRATLIQRAQGLIHHFQSSDLQEFQKTGRLSLGKIRIDTRSFDVFVDSERVALTPSEFNLLHALALHRGEVLTRDQLIAMVQGEGIVVIDRAIDAHVFSLRKKLGQHGNRIETVRGVGYRIQEL